jgi:transposase
MATYLLQARESGLGRCPLPPGRDDDAALEATLFQRDGRLPRDHAEPDWAKAATELKCKGVSLVLLWQECRSGHPDGYGYTWFCEQVRAFEDRTSPSFHNRHEAGAVMQADYAGPTIPITGSSNASCRAQVKTAPKIRHILFVGQRFPPTGDDGA